ncbi:MAG: hypothetical protein L0Z62_31330 [Gemmataceae bacterium]|nr:hypothetical protein [Gemmataceae bacterium]
MWSDLLGPAWLESATLSLVPVLILALSSLPWPGHAATAALLAATAFLLARSAERRPAQVEVPAAVWTWIGSMLILGGIVHLLGWGPGVGQVAHPWPVALLTHATLALGASLVLRRAEAGMTDQAGRETLDIDFVVPLDRSALVSSLLAVPLVMGLMPGSLGASAGHALWLAALWLVIAWRERWPALFAAFQVALGAAVVLALAAWRGLPESIGATLEELQVYGIGVAVLMLGWVIVRRLLRGHPLGEVLLNPGWPMPDRLALAALLLAQLAIAGLGILPGIVAELAPVVPGQPAVAPVFALGPAAWVLLTLLVVALLVEAWREISAPVLLGLVPLALAVPVLLAGGWADERAVASALRWGLGATFVVYSIPLWLRTPLARLLQRRGRLIDPGLDVSLAARWLLIAGAVLPVVLLTLAPLLVRTTGELSAGPLAGIFVAMPRVVATVLPLVLVGIGLVGHALREQEPAYAFTVGLGLHLGVSLLVWRHHVRRGEPLGDWWVYLAQLNALTGSIMALLWLGARRHLYGASRSGVLLAWQVAIGPALVAVVLGCLTVRIALQVGGAVPLDVARGGAWWGWGSLLLAGAVVGWHLRNREWQGVGAALAGFLAALAVLAACLIANGTEELRTGYHTLTVAWSATAALLLAAGWLGGGLAVTRFSRSGGERPAEAGHYEPGLLFPVPLVRAAVALLGGAVVALALGEAAFEPTRPAWPAGSMLAVSVVLAGMALWQRQEGWALAAALGLNAAVSLLVWAGRPPGEIEQVWIELAQANVFASAAAAVLWLMAARRIYGDSHPPASSAPLLSLQVILGLLGGAALLARPALLLILDPEFAHESVVWAGGPLRWLAVGSAFGAAALYLRQTAAYAGGHVLGALGLALGVLLGCTASRLYTPTPGWLPYHVLTVALAIAAALLLLAGWIRTSLRGEEARPDRPVDHTRTAWLAGYLALLVVLGLRGMAADPLRPWWPAGTILAAGGLATGLALWRRREVWAFVASLALNGAMSLVLAHFYQGRPLEAWWVQLVQANVLASAVAALMWQAGCRRLYGTGQPETSAAPLLNVQLALILFGGASLLVVPALTLIAEPGAVNSVVVEAGSVWGWLTLLAAGAALAWLVRRRWAEVGVHVLCSLGVALAVLMACSAARWDEPGRWLAFHTLTAALAVVGAGALVCGWPSSGEQGSARLSRPAVVGWVAALGALVLMLGLRGVETDPLHPWWPAGAVLAAGVLAGGLALSQSREGWALAAALSLNLAASLVVWHLHARESIWWVRLLQANVVASAAAALVWLSASPRLYGSRRPGVATAPLLALQMGLMLLGNVSLLLGPLVQLITAPGEPHATVLQAGEPGGWLALVSAVVAAGWYAGRILVRGAVHLLCGLGLAVGVLAACTASAWDMEVPWLSYHALMAMWVLTGSATLVGGWASIRHRTVSGEGARATLDSTVLAWVAGIGLLVLGLAARAAQHDPTGHAWAAGAVLAVAAMFAAVALHDRLEGWAFAAGLALLFAVSLVVWGRHLREPLERWWVELLQANVIAGAGAALAWLAARRRLYGTDSPGLTAAPLLNLQVALALAGNAVLLAAPLRWLIERPGSLSDLVKDAGQPSGWAALLTATLAAGWHLRAATGHVSIHLLGAVGLGLGVLAACTAGHWQQDGDWLAYHVLMVSWALTALVLLTAGWLVSARDSRSESPTFSEPLWSVRAWLTGVTVLVLALALRGAVDDPARPWWPAGMVLALGALTAGRAVWQRHEGWAFAAGLSLNLAVSLVLWKTDFLGLHDVWPLRFAQANVAAAALAGLLWLAARRRIYGARESGPLLTLQVMAALAGNALLLGGAAALLVIQPEPVHPVVALAGDGWGWLALVPALVTASCHFRQLATRQAPNILGSAVLCLGVLAASTAAGWQERGWLAYHTLMTGWVLAGAVVLAVGWRAARREGNPESTLFSAELVRAWVGGFCLLVVALALRAVAWDPAGPWWPAATVAAVALLAGAVALWQRREGWAFGSGLALNLAVSLAIWGQHVRAPFGDWWVVLLQANVLANAVTALVWLAAYRRLYPDRPPGRLLHLHVLLGLGGNVGLLAPPLALLVFNPASLPVSVADAGGWLGWLALIAASVVAAWHLHRAGGNVGLHALCGLGLAAGVLAACTAVEARQSGWVAYHVLTGAWVAVAFVVLVAGWRASRLRPALDVRPVLTWQTVIALLVVGLALRGFGQASLDPWGSVAAVLAVGLLFCLTALWRQHEGWAVAAGLAVNLAATLVFMHIEKGADWAGWWTALVQVNIISGAATTLIWLAVRRQRYLDRAEEIGASPILSIKIAAELMANALVLVAPLVLLVWQPGRQHDLVQEAGDVSGWLALGLSLTAAVWRFHHIAGRFGVYVVCGLGLTLGVLSACTANHLDQQQWLSYHVLVGVWALTGLVTVAAGWKGDTVSDSQVSSDGPPLPAPIPVFPAEVVRGWVLLFNVLLLGLALREAVERGTAPWWPAATLLAVAAMNGMTAAWQRSGSWAFAAGLCVNAAATVAVWKLNWEADADPARWWLELLQANVLAAAGTALVWLGARRQLYAPGSPAPAPSPLLGIQVILGLAGNAVLLIEPCVRLIADPTRVHDHVKQAGGEWGWLALVTATAAALWHLGQTRARAGLNLLCGVTLAAGVLAACTGARMHPEDGWLAYHVLMTGWALAGGVILAAGWLSARGGDSRRESPTIEPLVPLRMVRAWVGVVCGLLIGLALRGVGQDPSGYFWQAGAVLAVSVLAGGMALWQRSEGWTFTAALGINLAVSLLFWDYHTAHSVEHWQIRLAQANLITAAITALLWLWARWLDRTGAMRRGRVLLALHVGAVAVGTGCLLVAALGPMVGAPRQWAVGIAPAPFADPLLATGRGLGWLVLALTGAAVVTWTRQQGLTAPVSGAAVGGLVLLAQAACTVETVAPGWGYRALMLGWAAYSLAFVPLAWRLAQARAASEGAPARRRLGSEGWLGLMVLAVTGLALKAAIVHNDRLWAAAAVALVSASAAAMAAWRGRESWAFLAGLGVNLAVSLVVWDGLPQQEAHLWWMRLVQANVISGSVVALAWLAVARRLYGENRAGPVSLLSLQVALCIAGNAVLLVRPAALLIERPDPPHPHVIQAGTYWGWLALLLTIAAAVWHAGRILARGRLHVLCILGLALGVLTACTVAEGTRDGWLAYHTLTAAWALTGAAVLAGGWAGSRRPRLLDVPPGESPIETSPGAATGWVAGIGSVLLVLGLRWAVADPLAPWWPASSILTAGALTAGLALWARREGWALVAGLTLHLAVSLVLWHFQRGVPVERWWVYLAQANALAGAAAALLWLTASRRLYGVEDAKPQVARGRIPLVPSLLTVQLALALVPAVVPLIAAGAALIQQPDRVLTIVYQAGEITGWLALAAALFACLWCAGAAVLPGLVHVLASVGLALGVLAAGAAAWRDEGNFLAYHTLLSVWGLTGLAVFGLGWDNSRRATRDERTPPVPADAVQGWVAVLSAVVLALALRGLGLDPAGHAWAAGTALGVSLTAACLALWRRSEPWAFAGGLALSLAVSLWLWNAHLGRPLHEWWVLLIQANLIASSAIGLLWLAAGRRLHTGQGDRPLLSLQVGLALVGNVLLLAGPLERLLKTPYDVPVSVTQVGTEWGWLALLLALAAAGWHLGRTLARGAGHVLCLLGLSVGVLAACTAGHGDNPGSWLAYHTLTAVWALTGVAALVVGWRVSRPGQAEQTAEKTREAPGVLPGWVVVIGGLVVALALRELVPDSTHPAWPAGAMLVVSALAGGLAVWSRSQGYVYASGLLVCLGVTALARAWNAPLDLLRVNVLSLAACSALWSVLELTLRGRVPPVSLRRGGVPFSHLAVGLATCALVGLTAFAVGSDLTGGRLHAGGALTWLALGAAVMALLVSLRDPEARFPVGGLYALGLSALGLALHGRLPEVLSLTAPLLAGYVLLAALVWRAGATYPGLVVALAGEGRSQRWSAMWFAPAQGLLGATALVLSLWTCLGFPVAAERFLGPLAVALLVPAAVLASRDSIEWRGALQSAVLALIALVAVESGWALLAPGLVTAWLHRSGVLVSVCAPLAVLYGLVLTRRLPSETGWAARSERGGNVLGAVAVAALIIVLAQEVLLFPPGAAPRAALPSAGFIIAVAVAVAVLAATAICLAVVPGLDPFGMSERGRTAYVYAAEVLLVLLFVHLRLTAPELFTRRLERYWPFIVLGLAFLGAALAEGLRRMRLRVLAEPLERTGVFLPMLPVLIFWVQPLGQYATVWFLVGVLYLFLSITKRSLAFLLLAAVAVNVGLWLVLQQNQLAFIQHPQLWLIPFALTALGAEHLNRDRLSRPQRNAIRYGALTAIYLSSTAEVFLTGLGEDALRPMVLVGLSILGVFAGMLLRVRAFLFLGSAFLLLGVFALIRHAALAAADRGRIVWLVAGIVLGVVIFTLFAVFEKRRNDVMRLLQKLKDWE